MDNRDTATPSVPPAQPMSDQRVIETPTGYMIRCRACGERGWHNFPKAGKPGASWTFNGDLRRPTFSPSMNYLLNPTASPHHNPDAHLHDYRCHFTVTDGTITYHGDCSHSLRGTFDLDPWTQAEVDYYAALLNA